MPVVFRAVQELNMLAATVDRHTRVYTYIYMHIPIMYVYIFQVRISVIYTSIYCIYVHIRARWEMVIWIGFPKKMHVYCLYFDVSARIRFSILHVYCTYTRILYVYDSIDTPNNFAYRKYVKIRVYVQIRTIYIQYTYTNTYVIRQHTSIGICMYICMYMYLYTHVWLSTVAASMFSSYTALKMTGFAERHNRLCF